MRWKAHHLNLVCSFCGKSQRQVQRLIAGPTVYICNECVKVCQGVISQQTVDGPTARTLAKTARQLAHDLGVLPALPKSALDHALVLAEELEKLPDSKKISPVISKRHPDDLCCSFCGKVHHEVQYLVAGPSVCICDDCVRLTQGIIALHNTDPLQEFTRLARSLADDLKKLSTIPSTIADRARSLAVELKQLVTFDKLG